VPLFSFAYCGLGMMLIMCSIKISTVWSQAYHLTLTGLLDVYYNLPGYVGYVPYGCSQSFMFFLLRSYSLRFLTAGCCWPRSRPP
jgi:hypothetical protein